MSGPTDWNGPGFLSLVVVHPLAAESAADAVAARNAAEQTLAARQSEWFELDSQIATIRAAGQTTATVAKKLGELQMRQSLVDEAGLREAGEVRRANGEVHRICAAVFEDRNVMDPAALDALRNVTAAIDALHGTSDLVAAVESAVEAEEAAYLLFDQKLFVSGRTLVLRGSEQEMVGSPRQALDSAVNQFGRAPRLLAEAPREGSDRRGTVCRQSARPAGRRCTASDGSRPLWPGRKVPGRPGTSPKPRRHVTAAGIR